MPKRNRQSGSKYRAKPQHCDGIRFASIGEMRRYCELKFEQAAGEISGLVVHPRYPIEIFGRHVCYVELDFFYIRNGQPTYEDFKGFYTSESKLRHKLFTAYYGEPVMISRR